MMYRAMTAVLACALVVCWLSAPAATQMHSPASSPLTLTDKLPAASFSLPPDVVASAPAILALSITKVENPGRIGINVFVYLSFPQGSEGQKILIGNVSLYPSDHPAGFLLRSSTAFQQMKARSATSKSSKVDLLIEMSRANEREPWKPVKLVVAPPEWRKE